MVHGKGYYNGSITVDRGSHCYKQWKELMAQCHSAPYKKKNPNTNLSVCEDWNCYDNFYNWYNSRGFEEGTLTCKTTSPKGAYYCPETTSMLPLPWCRFLSWREGKGFNLLREGKPLVRVRNPLVSGSPRYTVGTYDTEYLAYQAFLNWKLETLLKLRLIYEKDQVLYNQLGLYEDYIRGKLT